MIRPSARLQLLHDTQAWEHQPHTKDNTHFYIGCLILGSEALIASAAQYTRLGRVYQGQLVLPLMFRQMFGDLRDPKTTAEDVLLAARIRDPGLTREVPLSIRRIELLKNYSTKADGERTSVGLNFDTDSITYAARNVRAIGKAIKRRGIESPFKSSSRRAEIASFTSTFQAIGLLQQLVEHDISGFSLSPAMVLEMPRQEAIRRPSLKA